ncbi:MAG: hypothetical protein KAT57_07995, partial [Candidatus Lokiarchaeota archaeon]|nr:hypothetical protein [Candidatus Lokiarchaeota archaeon]
RPLNTHLTHCPIFSRRYQGTDLFNLLFFFHGGASQLALTYWMGYWTRKYSITLVHPILKKPIDFLFTFGFQGISRILPICTYYGLCCKISGMEIIIPHDRFILNQVFINSRN